MGRVCDLYFSFTYVRFLTIFVDKSVSKGTSMTLSL